MIKGHGAKFGRSKEEAVAALLTAQSIEEAARAVGVATSTLLRWLKIPELQEVYREAKSAAFEQSSARLQQASGAAVSTLLKLMLEASSPHPRE